MTASLRPRLSSAPLVTSSALASGSPLADARLRLFFEGFAHLSPAPEVPPPKGFSCWGCRSCEFPRGPSDSGIGLGTQPPAEFCAVGADLFSRLGLKPESGLTPSVLAPVFIVDSQRNCCSLQCFFFPLAKAERAPRAASESPPRTRGQEVVLSPPRATATYLHLFAFQILLGARAPNPCSLFWLVQNKAVMPFWRHFSSSIHEDPRQHACRGESWILLDPPGFSWILELLQLIRVLMDYASEGNCAK